VGQDSNLVVHRIINDTIGIVSHDPTLAHLWRRLAALAFTTPTRPHLASVIRHPPSVIRHPPFVIRLFSFPIPRSEFRIPHFLAEGATHFLAPGKLGWPLSPLSPRSFFSDLYGEYWMLVGLTVSCSLLGIVLWGTITGSMLPFILKGLGMDPATSSAPFVATLVDVTGLIIYFSVALVILHGALL
jgi:hypothetical protein